MEKDRSAFGEEIGLFDAIVKRAKKFGIGQDFFRRLAFTDGALEAAVAAVDEFEILERPVSLKIARQILGRDKVVSAAQVAEIWDCSSEVDSRTPIHYHESTLRRCAEENQQGRDWRLLYVFGRTVDELHQMLCCVDLGCFYSEDWWAHKEEDFWTRDVSKSQEVDGYLLIDFRCASGEFSVATDDFKVFVSAESGDVNIWHCPCSIGVFAEALVTIWQHSREELALNWKHWGGCLRYLDGTRAHIFVSMDGGGRGIHIEKDSAMGEDPRIVNFARCLRYDF